MEKIEVTLCHNGKQAAGTDSEEPKTFDFDLRIKDVEIYFPSGHNGKVHIVFKLNANTIIPKSWINDSTTEYLCGDSSTLDIKPNIAVRRNEILSIIVDNTDLVNDHEFYINITIQKERL